MLKFIKYFRIVLILALPTGLVMASEDAVAGNGNEVAATVNGVEIVVHSLKAEINRRLPYSTYHSRVTPEKMQQIRSQSLQKLIEDELFFQEAERHKLDVNLIEVNQRIDMMKNGHATEEEFQKALAKAGLNALSLMARVKRLLLIQKIQQVQILETVTVTDETLREYFQKNMNKFIMPERFQTRHILISVFPGAMAAGWEEGLSKAEQTCKRIAGGTGFAMLARELSADSTSRENGGDIGWIHKGQLLPQLEEALHSMRIGEISKPVRSIYGFHILKLEGKQKEKQLTFDEINQAELKKRITKQKIEKRRQEFLGQLKSQAQIRILKLQGV